MKSLLSLEKIEEHLRDEPNRISAILPQIYPIAIGCRDYDGLCDLALWDKPFLDTAAANEAMLAGIERMMISSGISEEEARKHFQDAFVKSMGLRQIENGKICPLCAKEMEDFFERVDKALTIIDTPENLHPVDLYYRSKEDSNQKIRLLNERKSIEKLYAILTSIVQDKLLIYKSILLASGPNKRSRNEGNALRDDKGENNMDSRKKKYQVFISSTYEDLKEERAAVTQCLLDLEFIPVGMEQFPASGMSQMDYIKKMLADCDYYILILAGRYGSLDSDGIGFTEKEYDYAKTIGLPVMSFLVNNIEDLPVGKCEKDDNGRDHLSTFREKVKTSYLVRFYHNKDDLKAAVATSMQRCVKDFPARGWVRLERGEQTVSDDLLTKRIDEYITKRFPIYNGEVRIEKKNDNKGPNIIQRADGSLEIS